MSLPRYSVRMLLAGVAAISLTCAALLNASDFWAGATSLAAAALLVVALVGIILLRASARALCIGALICGGIYWAMMNVSWAENVGRRIGTRELLNALYEKVRTTTPATGQGPGMMGTGGAGMPGGGGGGAGMAGGGGASVPGGGGGGGAGMPGGGGGAGMPGGMRMPTQTFPDVYDFTSVGHALFTLLFTFLGGLLGRSFYVHGRGPPPKAAEHPA